MIPEACLAFALTVAHYHDMRKAMVPVPRSEAMEFVRDFKSDDMAAAVYAFDIPRGWNRGRVEIAAEEDCNNKELNGK